MACSWFLNQTANGKKELDMKGEREKESDNFNEGKTPSETTSLHVLGYCDPIASQTEKWEEKRIFLFYTNQEINSNVWRISLKRNEKRRRKFDNE